MQAQIDAQKMQLKGQVDVQVASAMHQMRMQIEQLKAQASLGFKTDVQEFREKLEVLKEDRKDDRVEKQTVEQSKLIAQRKGEIPRLPEQEEGSNDIEQFLDGLI